MRPGVERAGPPGMERNRDPGEDKHDHRHDEDREAGEFHLPGLDLFAQVLRCSPDHQPTDEHRDDGEEQDRVEATADPARRDLPEHHARQQAEPAHGVERVVGTARPTRSTSGSRRCRTARTGCRRSGPPCRPCCRSAGRERRPRPPRGWPGARRTTLKPTQTPKMITMAVSTATPWRMVPPSCRRRTSRRPGWRAGGRTRSRNGQPGRVLERVSAVGVEETPAVGAELLDWLHEGHRAHRRSPE